MTVGAIYEVEYSLHLTGLDPLRVLRVDVSEGLSEVGHCVVEAIAPSLDTRPGELLGVEGYLMAQRVRVQDGASSPVGDPAYFTGLVRAAEDRGVVHDARLIEVEVAPRMAVLALFKSSRFFHEKTPVEVVTDLLTVHAGYEGNKVDAAGARAASRELCTQWDETDLDFARRLLEEEGLCFLFTHGADDHGVKLLEGDRGSVFASSAIELPLMLDANSAQADAESVRTLDRSQRLSPRRVELVDWRWESQRLEGGADAPGNDVRLGEVAEHAASVRGEAPKSAARRVGQLGAESRLVRGTSNALALRPGVRFTVVDAYGDVSEEMLVVRVRHEGSAPEQLRGYSDEADRYRNSFEAVPSASGWRPPRVTPRVRATMPHLARVLNADGEQPVGAVALDTKGRVPVEFPWPLVGSDNAARRCMVPTMQPVASDGFGFHFAPRVGSEVLVSFIDGDPERPVLLGSVYPAAGQLPESVDALRTRSVLRTGTVTASGAEYKPGHFNELSFEDLEGSELLSMRAEKDMKVEVLNDRATTVGHDSTEAVENNLTLDVKVDRTETVGGNHKLSVEGDLDVSVQGKTSEYVANTWQISADEGLTLQCGGNAKVELVPNEITLTASSSLTLKVGGNTIEITASGITLKVGGSKVDLSQVSVKVESGAGSVAVGPATVNVNNGALEVM